MTVDPHQVLGVPPGATLEQIRKAYKQLARRHHPDHDPAPGAAARFIEIKAAHDELLRKLEAEERAGPSPGPPPMSPPPGRPVPEPLWRDEDVQQLQLRDLWRPALYAGGALVWFLVLWTSLYGIRQAAQALSPRPPTRPAVAAPAPAGHPGAP